MTANKLRQGNILVLEQEAFKKKEVKVTTGDKEFVVNIDKELKETKISKMFTELVERSDYARKHKLELDITAHILILLIKHFTDIEFIEHKTIKENMEVEIRTLNALINLGLFEQIINEFDKNEIDKMQELFKKHKEGIRRMADNHVAVEIVKNDI